jgi:hypothetical protein
VRLAGGLSLHTSADVDGAVACLAGGISLDTPADVEGAVARLSGGLSLDTSADVGALLAGCLHTFADVGAVAHLAGGMSSYICRCWSCGAPCWRAKF